jgi:hypothetical protein
MIEKCPGQDKRNLKTEDIRCSCGCYIEIFSDEHKRKCFKCGKIVERKRRQTCLDWCKYAKKCQEKQL